jgi:hypothetical protein
MTTLIPAIKKGAVLQLQQPLSVPDDTHVMVAVITGDMDGLERWSDGELRVFEAHAYGPDEPDYGTLDSLQ